MNKIVCKIDPGLNYQHILFYEDDVLQTQESIELNNLANYLLNTCYTENCYDLHFIGNWKFLEGIVQELSTKEVTQYSTNKIRMEIN